MEKILMIDDDTDDQWIIRDALEHLQTAEIATFASGGAHALLLLDQGFDAGTRPELIVLDLNMPMMNGTAVLNKLKSDSRFCDIPVIIYSTSINPFERDKCMALGAHSYIIKPVSVDESLKTAGAFLEFCK